MGKRRFDETRFLEQGHEECLKKELLGDLDDARWKLENWGKLYNEIHPHSELVTYHQPVCTGALYPVTDNRKVTYRC